NIFPNGEPGNCPGKPVPGSRTTIRIPRSRSRPPSTISSPFLTEVSNAFTASNDPTASCRIDPARAHHSEVEPGPQDCFSILDAIFGAVLSCHTNHHQPVHRSRGGRFSH